MTNIVVRGEVVYQCNICNRRIRVPANKYGLSVICHCTITANCKGKLSPVVSIQDILNTPDIPLEVSGVKDWTQRKLLYTHTQAVAMTTWLINHNLSNNPVFEVLVNVNGVYTPVFPTVKTIDQNTSQLIFPVAYSGVAQAITLSSQRNVSTPTPATSELVQISNKSGVITLATLDTSVSLATTFTFKVNNIQGTVLPLLYFSPNPAIETSPWTSSHRVYINRQLYSVRSIDMINDANNQFNFTNGAITNNSSMTLTHPVPTSNPFSDVFILLASTPYTSSDRIFNQIVDLSQITTGQLLYQNGNFYVSSSLIQNIYPYIHVVGN